MVTCQTLLRATWFFGGLFNYTTIQTLKDISEKDKRWREIAFYMCKCKSMADDIVQEMYLKFTNNDKVLNDFYISVTIKNIFLSKIKDKKKEVFFDFFKDTDIAQFGEYEIDDNERDMLNKFNKLPFHQKELIQENMTKSLRQIEKEFNINYHYVYREIKKAKTKILKK